MKIVHINGGSTGSTGKIMEGIAALASANGMEITIASPVTDTNRKNSNFLPIGSYYGRKLSELCARISGLSGCFSYFATWRLIRRLRSINPAIIHLHTLHSSYIHLPLLFRYLRKARVKVIWTLHDCWSFTGHCPHFLTIGCEKWKTECKNCDLYKSYPVSYFDNSRMMFHKKKKWFTSLGEAQIVTPCEWLSKHVKSSFLQKYPVRVIHNGIDLSVFRPIESGEKEKYAAGKQYLILGVSYGWDNSKGLDVFLSLYEKLDPACYQICLVGTSEETDKSLPSGITSIHRTHDREELVRLYSAADLFVNPTRADTFPTVNMEALACGTPVLTFETGGSGEMIDPSCGAVVPRGDVELLYQEIVRICEEKPFSTKACCAHARTFDQNEKYQAYINLYQECTEVADE